MGAGPPRKSGRVAFYDFDGTLVSGNVVTRYAWFAKRHPDRVRAGWRYAKALLGVPLWLGPRRRVAAHVQRCLFPTVSGL